MSIEELQARKEQVERKILERQEADKLAAIDRIVKLVDTNNIPIDVLVHALGGLPAKRKLGPAARQYRDPETGSTWSGRGKEPVWIRGKDRTKFRIL
ncbi:MAG: H-NS histone family protein [Devosia sp.]|nr:H-NS histone family protein [Devosia sp.]